MFIFLYDYMAGGICKHTNVAGMLLPLTCAWCKSKRVKWTREKNANRCRLLFPFARAKMKMNLYIVQCTYEPTLSAEHISFISHVFFSSRVSHTFHRIKMFYWPMSFESVFDPFFSVLSCFNLFKYFTTFSHKTYVFKWNSKLYAKINGQFFANVIAMHACWKKNCDTERKKIQCSDVTLYNKMNGTNSFDIQLI